jgi:hypothetical protein
LGALLLPAVRCSIAAFVMDFVSETIMKRRD